MRLRLTCSTVLLLLLCTLFILLWGVWGAIAFAVVGAFLFILRILWRHFFWKVSRRLFLTYLLIVIISLFMGVAVQSVFFYSTAGLMLHYEIDSRIQYTLDDLNFWCKRLDKFDNPSLLNAMTQRYPGINIYRPVPDGHYLAGNPHPIETKTYTTMKDYDNRWYLVLNDPGTARVEVPLDTIVSSCNLYLKGIHWWIQTGYQENGNVVGIHHARPFHIFLPRKGDWFDRFRFHSLYVWPPLLNRPERSSVTVNVNVKMDEGNEKADLVPILLMNISPRDIYRGLAPKVPGVPSAIIVVVITLCVAIFFLGGVALLIAAFTILRVNRSIRNLSRGGEAFSHGDLSYRIPIKGKPDELNLLSLRFNRMAESIERLIEEEKIKNRMMKEIEIASTIQRSLIPTTLALGPWETAVHFQPCDRVGGDYYDLFTCRDVPLFILGDVSGHGVPAAILMAMIKSAISLLIKGGASPDVILKDLHEFMTETVAGEQFITIQMVCFFPGSLQLYNAGHPPPLLLRNGKVTPLSHPALPVGLITGPKGDPLEHDLQSGDILFFYTDGLYEAANSDDDFFGLERVTRIVERAPTSPQLLLDAVLNDLDEFTGGRPLDDDLTLAAVKVP